MKNLLLTGLTGTLGPVVAAHFEQCGWQVMAWNHHQIDPNDQSATQRFWQQAEPDAVCHLALGSVDWAAGLAAHAAAADVPFVFTSTAMVFAARPQGPYGITAARNAEDAYGQYKICCEDAIWRVNPDAMIARLGWQIGAGRDGNQMLEHLWRQHEEQGTITASTRWFPATSRMDDTAAALMQLIERREPGLYHLDSNVDDQWSFFQLVMRLKAHFRCPWTVTATTDYDHDQRLVDERIKLPALSSWLVES